MGGSARNYALFFAIGAAAAVHCATGHIEIGLVAGALLIGVVTSAYLVQWFTCGDQELLCWVVRGKNKTHLLSKYDVPEQLWHARLLLAQVTAGAWVTLTSQTHLYIEDLGGEPTILSAQFPTDFGACLQAAA